MLSDIVSSGIFLLCNEVLVFSGNVSSGISYVQWSSCVIWYCFIWYFFCTVEFLCYLILFYLIFLLYSGALCYLVWFHLVFLLCNGAFVLSGIVSFGISFVQWISCVIWYCFICEMDWKVLELSGIVSYVSCDFVSSVQWMRWIMFVLCRNKAEKLFYVCDKYLRTVSVHPTNKHFFVTAGTDM